MAYTTPRTWVAGEFPTAAQFNANIRDNVAFLANPPACRVYHNTTQSIPDAIDTALVFNSERHDTNTMHSTVSLTGRITATTAGLYVLSFTGEMVAAADYVEVHAYWRRNGTTPIGVGPAIGTFTDGGVGVLFGCTTVAKLAAADYVEVMCRQNNTANVARNLASIAEYSPEATATWIGLG